MKKLEHVPGFYTKWHSAYTYQSTLHVVAPHLSVERTFLDQARGMFHECWCLGGALHQWLCIYHTEQRARPDCHRYVTGTVWYQCIPSHPTHVSLISLRNLMLLVECLLEATQELGNTTACSMNDDSVFTSGLLDSLLHTPPKTQCADKLKH